MNFKEIKELIKIIDESGLSELCIEQDDLKLILKKDKQDGTAALSGGVDEMVLRERIAMLSALQTGAYKANNVEQLSTTTPRESGQATVQHKVDQATLPIEQAHYVKSPIVGVFYSSQAPEMPAFVKAGDKVTKGQVLCIIEAMKMMNEITSDVDGEMLEVLIENQGTVEYGQSLFKIRKA